MAGVEYAGSAGYALRPLSRFRSVAFYKQHDPDLFNAVDHDRAESTGQTL